ncbi:MAG: hypothetical protein HOW97_22910 [Catenulispora sp.]|nr:hypothetical protein [Catenulispora sp.]
MKFVQIIDFQTEHMDEMREAMRQWEQQAATEDRDVKPTHRMVLQDRDHPNHYLVVVEFNSYEEAMKNSARDDTTALSEKLGALTSTRDFINCDVLDSKDI